MFVSSANAREPDSVTGEVLVTSESEVAWSFNLMSLPTPAHTLNVSRGVKQSPHEQISIRYAFWPSFYLTVWGQTVGVKS